MKKTRKKTNRVLLVIFLFLSLYPFTVKAQQTEIEKAVEDIKKDEELARQLANELMQPLPQDKRHRRANSPQAVANRQSMAKELLSNADKIKEGRENFQKILLSESSSDPVSLSQGWGLIYSTGKVVKGAYTREGPQGGDLLDSALAATRSPDTASQSLRWVRGAQGYAKTIEKGAIPTLSIVGVGTALFDLAQEPTLSSYFNTVRAFPGMQLYKGQTLVLDALINGEIAIIEKTFSSEVDKYLKGQDSEIQKEIEQYWKEDTWRKNIDQEIKERLKGGNSQENRSDKK